MKRISLAVAVFALPVILAGCVAEVPSGPDRVVVRERPRVVERPVVVERPTIVVRP